MSRKTVQMICAAVAMAVSAEVAVANQFSVVNNGAPLGGATVSVETLTGDPITTAQTNERGVATYDIRQSAAGEPLVFKVTDKAGNVSEHLLTQPSDKPWHLIAMDTQGGIIGYSKETYDHLMKAREPLNVGKNAEVGSGAKLESQAKSAVGGLGGGFGGSKGFKLGGGSRGGIKPMTFAGKDKKSDRNLKTVDDPIAEDDKRVFTDPDTGTKLAVGTRLTEGGLLVSNTILDSPGDGTFQSVSLMDPQGNMAGPTRYQIFQPYTDWWLTVHWWRDTYVDGQLVSHEEGGWSDEGRILDEQYQLPTGTDGVWNDLGFSNAVQGIRGLGTEFPIGMHRFYDEPMTLVIHVTRPDEDPVTTTPFVVALASTSAFSSDLLLLDKKIKAKKRQLDWHRFWNDPERERIDYSDTVFAQTPEQYESRLQELESELRDLEMQRDDLERRASGRSISPHLQPIVVMA